MQNFILLRVCGNFQVEPFSAISFKAKKNRHKNSLHSISGMIKDTKHFHFNFFLPSSLSIIFCIINNFNSIGQPFFDWRSRLSLETFLLWKRFIFTTLGWMEIIPIKIIFNFKILLFYFRFFSYSTWMNINFVFRFEVSYPFIFSKRAQRVIHCFLKSKIFSADWFIASNLLLFCTMSNRFSLPGGKNYSSLSGGKVLFYPFLEFSKRAKGKGNTKNYCTQC